MIRIQFLLALSCTVASLCSSGTAFADVVYSIDFETESNPSDYNPNYDQADPGGISTKSYDAGTGFDGSRALRVGFDTATEPFSVSYFTNIAQSAVDPPTSTNASDYILSFDVRIEGFNPGTTSVSTQFSLALNDVKYEGTLNSTEVYQTVTANLGSLNETQGGMLDLNDFNTGTRQFRVAFLGLNDKFEETATNNAYFVDNITLSTVTAVPEPSSLALLAISGVGIVALRRRKSAC
ncbi:PEP-CTERM sorting domain-containing protein [Neorhodopirellula lusitana]|uniref:PEP-CTERM sorting domain-containing protein n=1 Tax=Neorhodopirellula lusitana TaxID=445327 RepID=UPI00384E14CF